MIKWFKKKEEKKEEEKIDKIKAELEMEKGRSYYYAQWMQRYC